MAMKIKSVTSRLAGYYSTYNFLGLLVGAVFVIASFLPSLLPRGWILQGVLSGILFAFGYAIGVAASFFVREFRPNEPDAATKNRIKKIALAVMAGLYVVFLGL